MSKLNTYAPTSKGITAAAKILQAGGVIAFPTETVYGLGADATQAQAVAKIYAAKGRPSFNPLIAHVADMDMAEQIAVFDGTARALAKAFWPGPLTLVLPLQDGHGLAPAVTAGLPTVALRQPGHQVAAALIQAAGVPLAAPSANPSGQISPTQAAHVIKGLEGRIDGVIDGGDCSVGVESTILAISPTPRILRPGGVTRAEIEAVLGQRIPFAADSPGAVTAPGQLSSHYAPKVPVRINASAARSGETFIAFGPNPGGMTLSETGDLAQAAETLFAALHTAEAIGNPIAIAPVPDEGLGRAINDRLRRAAAG
ncbi:MAG: L-threonylcarbamoyladenylate synthase [Planktomarina sp.]